MPRNGLEGTQNMIDNKPGSEFTKEREGFSEKVYTDTVGVPTIGHGFNLKASKTKQVLNALGFDVKKLLAGQQKMSREDADKVFNVLYSNAKNEASMVYGDQAFQSAPESVQDIVTDMVYNMGAGAVSQFKPTLDLIKNGKYNEAADRLTKTKWYKQVGVRSKAIVKELRSL